MKETVEEFLKRGGTIKKVEFGVLTQIERGGGRKLKQGEALKKQMESNSVERGRLKSG